MSCAQCKHVHVQTLGLLSGPIPAEVVDYVQHDCCDGSAEDYPTKLVCGRRTLADAGTGGLDEVVKRTTTRIFTDFGGGQVEDYLSHL